MPVTPYMWPPSLKNCAISRQRSPRWKKLPSLVVPRLQSRLGPFLRRRTVQTPTGFAPNRANWMLVFGGSSNRPCNGRSAALLRLLDHSPAVSEMHHTLGRNGKFSARLVYEAATLRKVQQVPIIEKFMNTSQTFNRYLHGFFTHCSLSFGHQTRPQRKIRPARISLR